MEPQPVITAQNSLPALHQRYLDYRHALDRGDDKCISEPLEKGFYALLQSDDSSFEINANGWSLMTYAIYYRDMETITHILAKNPRIDKLPRSTALDLLEKALASANIRLLNLLITHGLDIDLRDGSECSPLMLAASRCDLDVCSLLLACGANIKFVNMISKKSILASAVESSAKQNDKIELLNFLLLRYWSKNFEPVLSKIDIPESIAKSIFLFGATKESEIVTTSTHPTFKYAYQDETHFLEMLSIEVEKTQTSGDNSAAHSSTTKQTTDNKTHDDKVNQAENLDRTDNTSKNDTIPLKVLYQAIMHCLEIDPENTKLNKLLRDCLERDPQRAEFKKFHIDLLENDPKNTLLQNIKQMIDELKVRPTLDLKSNVTPAESCSLRLSPSGSP